MIQLNHGVELLTRSEWGARARRSSTSVHPTFGCAGHWQGSTSAWPWDHSVCASIVRGIQRYHMDSRGWVDIAYNALTCPHGYAFEGRGRQVRSAAQGTTDGNNRALAVCDLAGPGVPLTAGSKRAQRAAMDWLQAGGAGPGRNSHRDWRNTDCPGDARHEWIHSGQPLSGQPATPPPPPSSGGTSTVNVPLPILERGSNGGAVRSLQGLLNTKASQRLAVDGDFGRLTEKAVIDVQSYLRLQVDGIVGRQTWGVLFL